MGEAYVQTLGASDPHEYLLQAADPCYGRGELWALGRYYTGASASWQLAPTIGLSGTVLANLQDPSALLMPGLAWSVADEAEVAFGAFFASATTANPAAGPERPSLASLAVGTVGGAAAGVRRGRVRVPTVRTAAASPHGRDRPARDAQDLAGPGSQRRE